MVVQIDSLAAGNQLRRCFHRSDAHAITVSPGGSHTIGLAAPAASEDPFRFMQLQFLVGHQRTVRILQRDLNDIIPDHEV